MKLRLLSFLAPGLSLLAQLSCTHPDSMASIGGPRLAPADSLMTSVTETPLGEVTSACPLGEEWTAVLDGLGNRLVLFSRDGMPVLERLLRGSGPGEFSAATSVAPAVNGGVWVLGPNERKAVEFDSSLNLVREVIFSGELIPGRISELRDGRLVGLTAFFPEDDGHPGNAVVVFSPEGEPERVIMSAAGSSRFFRLNILVFASDNESLIFSARTRGECCSISCFSPEGDSIPGISVPEMRMERKPEELVNRETEEIESVFQRWSMEATVSPGDLVDPTFPYIDYMGVDGEGRLWVLRGNHLNPVFDVFDMEGNRLFVCGVELPARQECDRWRFSVERGGILAWPENPGTSPAVYRMAVVGSAR